MPENIITSGAEQNKYFPYADKFHLQRSSFWAAGQDSFTLPPAQNPDLFVQLKNIEPTLQGTLRRRRGYQNLSNQAPTSPYLLGYSYRNEATQERAIIYTSASAVTALSESGGTIAASIFTPSLNAKAARMVLSRDFAYFVDGVEADSQKWDGTTVSNWGISIASSSSISSTAATSPTAFSQTTGGVGVSWTNLSNLASNVSFASVSLTPSGGTAVSQRAFAGTFGFAIPTTDTIFGIEVVLQAKAAGGSSGGLGLGVGITANGVNGTGFFAPQFDPTTSAQSYTFGGPNSALGSAFTATQVNSANFGVQLYYQTNITNTVSVNSVTVKIFHGTGSFITVGSPTGVGSINLISGRTYFCVFQNSSTGHTSGLNAASSSTGPVSGKASIPLSTIPVSSDPQVDSRIVLATADGNDETTLYLLTIISDNTTTTFSDTTTDSALLTQPVYQYTDTAGILHGVANNNPPPLIGFPTKHKGRIYGAIKNSLFFSKNLDEVTTNTGTITGKWEEAWPATNTLDISETAETIQGLLSDGETLWMGTERAIRRLVGDSPDNFQLPEIQFNETGLLNQDVWRVVFSEGQPVGTMWLTPDFKVMFSDFNTYQDIGTPVQDILNGINTSATVIAHASFVSEGPANYYMLYISTGTNAYPDTCLVYNLGSKTWSVWLPFDAATGSLFFIDATGLPRWTFASQAGPIWEWKSGIFQDRVNTPIGGGPDNFICTAQTSWLDFGDPTLRKGLNQILIGTGDSGLLVSVQGSTSFLSAPVTLLSLASVSVNALSDLFVPLASLGTFYRWYRFTFSSPSGAGSQIPQFLDFYNVEAVPIHRW